jgi:hypothetical protein
MDQKTIAVVQLAGHMARVGPCYHPETNYSDYQEKDGTPVFNEKTAERLDQELENIANVLAEDFWDVALALYDGMFMTNLLEQVKDGKRYKEDWKNA